MHPNLGLFCKLVVDQTDSRLHCHIALPLSCWLKSWQNENDICLLHSLSCHSGFNARESLRCYHYRFTFLDWEVSNVGIFFNFSCFFETKELLDCTFTADLLPKLGSKCQIPEREHISTEQLGGFCSYWLLKWFKRLGNFFCLPQGKDTNVIGSSKKFGQLGNGFLVYIWLWKRHFLFVSK